MDRHRALFALAFVLLQASAVLSECTEEGFSCSNCITSHECVDEGGWFNETIITCEAGETCNQNNGLCMTNPNPLCQGIPYRFVCIQPGVFPHPLDCTRYFMCRVDGGGSIISLPRSMSCPSGFAYDAYTRVCSKQYVDTCDHIIASSCERVGNEGAVLDNVYMYYYCLNVDIGGEQSLTPQLFFCNNGQKYINGICRNPTPPSIPLDNGLCTASGDIYDPNDCRRFFRCVKDEQPERMNCEPGSHFDGWKRECIEYECPK